MLPYSVPNPRSHPDRLPSRRSSHTIRRLPGHGPEPKGVPEVPGGSLLPGLPRPRPSPRLVSAASPTSQGIGPVHVERLVTLLHDGEGGAVSGFVSELLEEKHPLDEVFLDLVEPAARRVGELWEDDRFGFVEVTRIVGRLQSIFRDLAGRFGPGSAAEFSRVGRFYLAGMPKTQHTLGLNMVAEFLLRAGWSVRIGSPLDGVDALQVLEKEWFDVAGFSLAHDRDSDALAGMIDQARKRSKNPEISVMIGGSLVEGDPSVVSWIGADAWAPDARAAVEVAGEVL